MYIRGSMKQSICPTPHQTGSGSRTGKRIPLNDPYRYYPGQQGHFVQTCQDLNKSTLCRMTLQTVTPSQTQPNVVIDDYLTLDEPLTERVVSCQNISPSYYPNMTQEMIGKRPVYTVRNCEYNIPDIILQNRDQLVNRDFICHQPQWGWTCM